MSNYIKMRCEDCGAIMEVDENKRILYCPYCGAKKLVEETDDVKKATLESVTRIHEADKNAEMAKDRAKADIEESRQKTLQTIFGGDNAMMLFALIAVLIMLGMMACI